MHEGGVIAGFYGNINFYHAVIVNVSRCKFPYFIIVVSEYYEIC